MRKKNTCTHAAVSASGSLMHHSLCVCFHLRLKQQTAIFERKLGLKAKQVAPEKSRCVLIYHKSQMDFLDRRIHSQICFGFFPQILNNTACTDSIRKLVCTSCHPMRRITQVSFLIIQNSFPFLKKNCRTPTRARAHTAI